jgi:RNase H-like domain found in reverse transcriptase/Reverse transcriptase (RNA-dependent DNA polymerase)/Integrase zinc binding domain/Integrase core domain/Aspartyl protease/Chromo (CHRromatin Organisation MOdifier) domain
MIDSGASGYAFIDETFAQSHHLPLQPLRYPRRLDVADGSPTSSGSITRLAELRLSVANHHESVPCFVTKLGHYPIILGKTWLSRHNPKIDWGLNTVTFNSDHCRHSCTAPRYFPVQVSGMTSIPDEFLPIGISKSKPLDLCMIGAAPFATLIKRKNVEVFAISMRDIEKALSPKKYVDPAAKLPTIYHDILDAFSKADADTLPPRRPYDHKINLEAGKTPPYGPLYGMSQDELRVLKKYLDDNLKKGFISPSTSQAASPVLFVKKPGGGLRFCVDYRALNAITVKDRYPLPLVTETLARLSKAKYFTKLDVIAAFNRMRIADGDEWKTAFRTRYGLFEYNVVPFGLSNAPSAFQHFINDVLHEHLDEFCSAYIDDILIYSDDLESHQKHVRWVLEATRKAGLQLDIEKCEFHVSEVTYLGLIVSTEGIRMDPHKVEAVLNWETPRNLKDIQAFIGFANFYRRFVRGFSAAAAPLLRLSRKDIPFAWSKECETAFQDLKYRFCTAPILMRFDPDKEILVETDASDFVSAGVLSQRDDSGVLRPVAYFSKKHTAAECNYEIYDKELLAIIRCFEEWRPELEGSPFPIAVLTDHKNLEYFMSTKKLTRRQVRWAEFLSRFHFKITYRPGKLGGKPDALTRRSGDLPQEGDERLSHQEQTVLKPHNFDIDPLLLAPMDIQRPAEEATEEFDRAQSLEPEPHGPTLEDALSRAYLEDPFPNQVLEMLRSGTRYCKDISLAECSEVEGRLYYRNKLYVPNSHKLRMRLCKEHHDHPVAGHPGVAKTFNLIRREYYWPNFHTFIQRYVSHCDVCRRTKSRRHRRHGVLKPLPVPDRRWKDISIDFVTGLPLSNGFDAVLVVVDRLTKRRHLVACHTTCSAHDLAEIFVQRVWSWHGLPSSIVSDRGPQFVAEFWKALCAQLLINPLLSTAYHPETDGQTEIMNATMEQYLRSYVNYLQDDWYRWLPLAEFANNNHDSETTGISPFFADTGYHPRMGFEPPSNQGGTPSLEADEFATHMQEIIQHCQEEMTLAQAKYAEHTDDRRSPAPSYQPGDMVFLDARNLRTHRPSRKLDFKNQGPFPIVERISPYAYRLDLPNTMQVHPVFHTSLLSPAGTNPHPGHLQPTTPPVIVDGEEEFQIEQILDSKRGRGKGGPITYLVKWTGWDQVNWEPYNTVRDTEAVERFHRQYPHKPIPQGFWDQP